MLSFSTDSNCAYERCRHLPVTVTGAAIHQEWNEEAVHEDECSLQRLLTQHTATHVQSCSSSRELVVYNYWSVQQISLEYWQTQKMNFRALVFLLLAASHLCKSLSTMLPAWIMHKTSTIYYSYIEHHFSYVYTHSGSGWSVYVPT